jgi:rod shape-determining protein MreC
VVVVTLPFRGVIRSLFLTVTVNQLQLSKTSCARTIDDYKKENLLLKLQLKEYQSLEKENQKLRNVLNLISTESIKLLAADVIAFSPTTWRRLATLNRGENEGVRKGYYAIDEKGNLLGKIIEVDDHTSELVFVDDPDFTASVFVGSHGYGLLKGNLSGAKLLYVEDGEGIAKGDKVWMRLPALASDINIGVVKDTSKDENSLFWDVDISLTTTNSFFNRVYLVQ